ncbi:uncharacterized protein [Diabrotica undecimpunctata]|uniref:uncharacterized protein n=1 Tax=Diabrotica undecimpunctata TaxID=50387 RepID=UPI003B631DF7
MKSVTVPIFLLALAVQTSLAGVISDPNFTNQQNYDQEKQETFNHQEHSDYGSNDIADHEAQISQQAAGGQHGGGDYGGDHGYGDQQGWTGYSGEAGHDGGAQQSHAALENLGNLGSLISHGINIGGHDGGHEGGHDIGGADLHPQVEVQHDHIPTHTIEKTKEVPVTVVKKIGVPVPHPVGVPTPQIIKVPVPQPYAVHVPVPHPIAVPIYKLVPQEIEKRVPIQVEKLVPVYVEKPVKIEIEKHHIEYFDKPYPVHVPVYKHVLHTSGHKKW